MNEYLKAYPYFCLWKYIDGRKVPFSPKGGAARSNDPSTFDTYANTAPKATGEYQLGVGLFGDLSAIDIDDCIQDGKISDKALDIIQAVPKGIGIRQRDFHIRCDCLQAISLVPAEHSYIRAWVSAMRIKDGNIFQLLFNLMQMCFITEPHIQVIDFQRS